MMRTLLLVLLVGSQGTASLLAQGPSDPAEAYPVGLALSYGVGAYGVKDESISAERYEGTLPYLGVSWARWHGSHVYRAELELRQSDDIRNHTVRTGITRFVLGQAFLYPLGSRAALGRDVGLFLGPTMEAAVIYNEQHIAVSSLGFAQSVAALISLGAQADAVAPVSGRITGLASVRTSVLGLGIHAVDDETDDATPAKLLTPLTGTNASFEMGAVYHVTDRFSVRLSYLLQLGRITAWNPLLDASDSVVGRVSWRF